VVGVGMTYSIVVVMMTPDYLRLVRWAGPVYAASSLASVRSLVANPAVFVSMGAWLALAMVRPRGNYRACCEVILIANLSLLAIVFIQYKGYSYHYYPLLASAMLLMGLLLLESRGPGTELGRITGVLSGGVVALLIFQASVDRVNESLGWRGAPERSKTPFGRLARLAECYATGSRIFVFSPALADAFPLVAYSRVGWASRHSCLWFLTGLYAEEIHASSPLSYHPLESMSEAERFLFNSVVNDLLRERPALLFVDESNHEAAFNGKHFDYLDYFSRDPRFLRFKRHYKYLTNVDAFRVYRRT
jgi:hypothetical protein